VARRVSMPAADDLFRPTGAHDAADTPRRVSPVRAVEDAPEEQPARRSSGRIRHDEKMTVYVTAEELHHLETARLAIRANHGYAVDRGRLVREALAIALADFEENGEDSVLVRRLSER
jgi:hypothetical protein